MRDMLLTMVEHRRAGGDALSGSNGVGADIGRDLQLLEIGKVKSCATAGEVAIVATARWFLRVASRRESGKGKIGNDGGERLIRKAARCPTAARSGAN